MGLAVYQCGCKMCSSLQMKKSEPGGHYLFYYILSGTGVLQVEEEPGSISDYHLSAGSGFLVEPGKEMCYQTVPEENWDYIWVEFGGVRAGEYMNFAGLSCAQPMYMPQKPEQREELLQSLLALVKSEEEYPLRMTGYLYIFVDYLVRTSGNRKELLEGRKQETYVRKAVRYIEQNYSGRLSVEELARQFWLDRSYFGKVFKSVTGQSPQQFILSFRMERAAEKLTAGSTPIGDIGAAVGYPNLLNFSRAFKGVYGVSPREYRQRHRMVV